MTALRSRKFWPKQFDGLSDSVPNADKTLARQFSAQGKTETLEKSPDWLKNGGEWTHVLNRFAFLRPMGEAYWQTGDDKYADDAAFLLRDWIARNPIPEELGKTTYAQGTAWRSLETGIRLQTWLEAQQFFMDAPAFDAETQYQITRSMIEHARRLYQLESLYRAGNWQVNEAAGLSSVGIMLPEFKESVEWRKRGFQYMVEHMQKDVLADGAHHELTPGYHSWVMNQFLQVALLAKKNGTEVPGLLDRHEKMYEYLAKISRPDGDVPPIGDAHPQPIANDMGIGALLYNRADFRHFGPDKAQADWVWDFGPGVVNRYAQLSSKLPDYTSTLLPDAQFGIMRSGWNKNDDYLLFDMAPWGGNHSHADRLQVLLYAGRDLLLDPGQYPYDLPLSQYFKTAVEHNLLLIDGDKQIQADSKVLAWQDQPNALFTSASIEDETFRHQRSVLWVKPNYWILVDYVTAVNAADVKPHEVTRLFHFPLSSTKIENNSVQTTFAEGTNLQIQNIGAGRAANARRLDSDRRRERRKSARRGLRQPGRVADDFGYLVDAVRRCESVAESRSVARHQCGDALASFVCRRAERRNCAGRAADATPNRDAPNQRPRARGATRRAGRKRYSNAVVQLGVSFSATSQGVCSGAVRRSNCGMSNCGMFCFKKLTL